jgi:ribosomal protein S18 acetylase RimI-like enzyme
MARVHIDTWRTTYEGIVPAAHLAGLSYERSAARWVEYLTQLAPKELILVAETPTGQVVGFASAGPLREPLADCDAEIYAIYILQTYQHLGLGRQLVVQCARELADKGFRSLVIWALKENPACGFYERLGGQRSAEKLVEIGGVSLVDVAFIWRDLTVLSTS